MILYNTLKMSNWCVVGPDYGENQESQTHDQPTTSIINSRLSLLLSVNIFKIKSETF